MNRPYDGNGLVLQQFNVCVCVCNMVREPFTIHFTYHTPTLAMRNRYIGDTLLYGATKCTVEWCKFSIDTIWNDHNQCSAQNTAILQHDTSHQSYEFQSTLHKHEQWRTQKIDRNNPKIHGNHDIHRRLVFIARRSRKKVENLHAIHSEASSMQKMCPEWFVSCWACAIVCVCVCCYCYYHYYNLNEMRL